MGAIWVWGGKLKDGPEKGPFAGFSSDTDRLDLCLTYACGLSPQPLVPSDVSFPYWEGASAFVFSTTYRVTFVFSTTYRVTFLDIILLLKTKTKSAPIP